MSLQVGEEAFDRTTQCPHEFICLDEGKCARCRIKKTIPHDGLMILGDRPNGDCPYLMSFGCSWMCLCPTRHDLFERYGK
jgi:hypothetical protein